MTNLREAEMWRQLAEQDANRMPASGPRITVREKGNQEKIFKTVLSTIVIVALLLGGIIASEQTGSKKNINQGSSSVPPAGVDNRALSPQK